MVAEKAITSKHRGRPAKAVAFPEKAAVQATNAGQIQIWGFKPDDLGKEVRKGQYLSAVNPNAAYGVQTVDKDGKNNGNTDVIETLVQLGRPVPKHVVAFYYPRQRANAIQAMFRIYFHSKGMEVTFE